MYCWCVWVCVCVLTQLNLSVLEKLSDVLMEICCIAVHDVDTSGTW